MTDEVTDAVTDAEALPPDRLVMTPPDRLRHDGGPNEGRYDGGPNEGRYDGGPTKTAMTAVQRLVLAATRRDEATGMWQAGYFDEEAKSHGIKVSPRSAASIAAAT
mgnify:CR=1 FL=1